MKEGCQTPQILEAGKRMIKLLKFKHVSPLKKRKCNSKTRALILEARAMCVEARAMDTETGTPCPKGGAIDPEARASNPQRTIPRPCNLISFVLPDFKTV